MAQNEVCLRQVYETSSLVKLKILHWSKLKVFADDKFNFAKMMISVCGRVEKIGKRRKCLLPAFLPLPTMFSKAFCLTRNPGVLGSSRTGSSGFFRGSVFGQDTSEPSLVLVKPRKA